MTQILNNFPYKKQIVIFLNQLLNSCWPAAWKRVPHLKKSGLNPQKIDGKALFISSRDTSTLGYYFKSRNPDGRYVLTLKTKPNLKDIPQGQPLVIVRCIALSWLLFIRKHPDHFSSIIFFMDDDLPAIVEDNNLPLDYVIKRAVSYIVNCLLLDSLCDRVLVSTETLANKYGLSQEDILLPKKLVLPVVGPPFYQENSLRTDCKTIFYHGSIVHIQEMYWLHSIVKEVLAKYPHSLFEIIGGVDVKFMYSDLQRVRVVHPMEWEKYLEYTSTVNYDIGLAPLLPTTFNECRSYVKYFDITRTGAIGIYSEGPVYNAVVRHQENGYLLENDKNIWVGTICNLLEEK